MQTAATTRAISASPGHSQNPTNHGLWQWAKHVWVPAGAGTKSHHLLPAPRKPQAHPGGVCSMESPCRFTRTPLSYRGASPSERWSHSSARAVRVPGRLPRGAGATMPQLLALVSFRVAHLKFQLAGCFCAGGMQNQPTNTNKYLQYPPPPPPILIFILTSQLVLGGKTGFESFP